MRVALVHDWLTGMRGGEYVLERFCRMFPGAPIYTLVWNPGSVSREIESHPIHASFLQRAPGVARHYRWYLPLFPAAIESFRLAGFDAVISSSHAVAKGIRVPADTYHFSFVHTPMRYVWELEEAYFPPGRFPWPLDAFVRGTCARLRRWDVVTSQKPDTLVANSRHVAERIARHYGRRAEVVAVPVDLSRFSPGDGPREYDLVVGAFAPNKRVDLALEACRRLDRRLIVVGSGQETKRLLPLAGPRTEFLGWVDNAVVARLYAGARALLFPGEEDMGIVPIEAMASGCPVVAFGRGGALESVGRGAGAGALAEVAGGGVAEAPGGVLFGTQTVEGLTQALARLEATRFEPARLRAQTAPFAAEAFDARVRSAFDRGHAAWRDRRRSALIHPPGLGAASG
jgi:glycosyltransferase involved in cell wall biosynthesis